MVTARLYAILRPMSSDKKTNMSGSVGSDDSRRNGPLPSDDSIPSTRLLGVRIDCVDDAYILARMRAALEGRAAPLTVTYVHFDTLLLAHDHADIRDALERADIVFPDGIALHVFLRMLRHHSMRRFSSPDLNERAIRQCATVGSRILCAGGTLQVAERMSQVLHAMGHSVDRATSVDGWTTRDDTEWTAVLATSRPEMIVLGMGGALQNILLHHLHHIAQARVSFAVGACFDLLTGTTVRPPRWMWRFGLEWSARLVQEPRRLWRRYLLRFPRFVVLVLQELMRSR